LHVISITGDNMKKVTANYDRDPLDMRWAADSSGLYFDSEDHGSRNVQFAPLNGILRAVTAGTHVLTLDSVSRDFVAAGTETDPDHPQDVVRYDLQKPGSLVKLTDVNGDILAGKRLAKTEELTYKSTG